MAVFIGNSSLGIQSLAVFQTINSTVIAIDLPAFDPSDYKQRLGLILVRQVIPDGVNRVVDVKKLFATGVLFKPTYPFSSTLEYQVAVDWYVQGTPWVLNTFG